MVTKVYQNKKTKTAVDATLVLIRKTSANLLFHKNFLRIVLYKYTWNCFQYSHKFRYFHMENRHMDKLEKWTIFSQEGN